MQDSTYQIGRLTYEQGELNYKQDKKLLGLLKSAANGEAADTDLTMGELRDALIEHDLLGVFLGIVLRPRLNGYYLLWKVWDTLRWILQIRKGPFAYVDPDLATNTTLGQIFDDFFFLNAALMSSLQNSGNTLGLILGAAKEMFPSPSNSMAAQTSEHSTAS